ncbi:MmgE/PrpD family protein [Cupriavidus sp. CuC1]|uniref:MmgE/PrpD family protein n=1 Tax=Cupriavidus sp. CuC1 TaxID=3373131 RepID=UPI0037D2C45B
MTVAVELAEFVTRTHYEEVPVKAIDYAAMLISSTMASAAMGSNLESSRIVRSMLVQRGGAGEASAWFGGAPRLPVASAARINALMSDAAASDDSDLRNITHPGTTLTAAAIAVAEKTGANGKDVLAAIALGYEVAGRINTGVVPGLIWEKGFHGCMITIFGGAVAAGLLLKLDVKQMTHALALAATSNAGLLAAANTSTAREHHAGLAAMLGVEAAQLAGLGYTAEESVLEHPRGFFFAYGQDAHVSGRVAEVTRGLGDDWKILTDMAIKLVPGGHPYHAIGEAAANAARMADVPASEITAIICSRPNARQIKGPRHPTDLIGVAHSPYYFAAAGAVDREFTWAHASPEKIMDPAIRRLLDLVEVGEPPTENVERYKQGATVTVKARDGRSFTSTVYAPRGSAVNGIEWSDVEGKFNTLCPLAGISPSNIARCTQVLRHFRGVKHVRELVELIG